MGGCAKIETVTIRCMAYLVFSVHWETWGSFTCNVCYRQGNDSFYRFIAMKEFRDLCRECTYKAFGELDANANYIYFVTRHCTVRVYSNRCHEVNHSGWFNTNEHLLIKHKL